MITLDNISIRNGAFVLENVNFHVPEGAYCGLMGRTGCGKTTILEAVYGLKRVVSGKLVIDGRDMTDARPAVRGIGFVPQDGALFSTASVRDHLGFALKIRKWPRARVDERVDELATVLGIDRLLDRKPEGLSGGERQRVALGRALSFHPRVLCLDEPLSALDDTTREEMFVLLRRVCRDTNVTALHITHNVEEVRRLATMLLVLEGGTLRERAVE